MATTLQMRYLLENQFSGWVWDGPNGLREYLDQAHDMLCRIPAELFVQYDGSGKLPAFDTTALEYSYSAPSTAWMIEKILVEIGDTGTLLDTLGLNDYGRRYSTSARFERFVFGGISYYNISYVRSWPATETANARIEFTANPGTTSGKYRMLRYAKPNAIISDSIALSIPPPYDMKYLLPAVCRLIKAAQNENSDLIEAIAWIEGEIKPKLQKELNKGAQGVDYEPEARGF